MVVNGFRRHSGVYGDLAAVLLVVQKVASKTGHPISKRATHELVCLIVKIKGPSGRRGE